MYNVRKKYTELAEKLGLEIEGEEFDHSCGWRGATFTNPRTGESIYIEQSSQFGFVAELAGAKFYKCSHRSLPDRHVLSVDELSSLRSDYGHFELVAPEEVPSWPANPWLCTRIVSRNEAIRMI